MVAALAGKLRDDLSRLCDVDLGGEIGPTDVVIDPGAARAVGLDHSGSGRGAIGDLAESLQTGRSSVAAMVDQCLTQIADTDAAVQAWVRVDAEGARAQAANRDAELRGGQSRGVLHGLPVGIKDIVDVRGLPTAAGSRQFSDPGRERRPEADAAVVQALRTAGAVIAGKTTTHEFAFGGTTPPTCNPRDLARTAGGSSGGSAAAIAAGQVLLTVGTDTVGSVRIPASYCGVVGWLPSRGLISNHGVLPLAWSIDRVGLMTPSVADLANVALALGLVRPADGAVPDRPLRIGVPTDAFDNPIDTTARESTRHALDALVERGAEVVSVELPHSWAAPVLGMTITMAESVDYHRSRLADSADLFAEDVRSWLESAAEMPAAAYVRALRMRQVLRQEVADALQTVDLIATPTMPCVAPTWAKVGQRRIEVGGVDLSITEAHLRYTAVVNLAGVPAATQPCGIDATGLPVGLQFIAAPGRDDLLIRAMLTTEAALGIALRMEVRTKESRC